MAANNVYVMESANLICGNARGPAAGGGQAQTAPGISTHLVLQELKLPGFEENTVDHAPGGAMVAIEVPTHINKLEATFNLAGWDPQVMGLLAQNDPMHQIFTAYGLIRDRRTSDALQAIAVIQGRLGRVNPTAFSKGNMMAHEYSIKSIVHYKLVMQLDSNNNQPTIIYLWDFFTSRLRSGRSELTNDLVEMLRIPANPPPGVDFGEATA